MSVVRWKGKKLLRKSFCHTPQWGWEMAQAGHGTEHLASHCNPWEQGSEVPCDQNLSPKHEKGISRPRLGTVSFWELCCPFLRVLFWSIARRLSGLSHSPQHLLHTILVLKWDKGTAAACSRKIHLRTLASLKQNTACMKFWVGLMAGNLKETTGGCRAATPHVSVARPAGRATKRLYWGSLAQGCFLSERRGMWLC